MKNTGLQIVRKFTPFSDNRSFIYTCITVETTVWLLRTPVECVNRIVSDFTSHLSTRPLLLASQRRSCVLTPEPKIKSEKVSKWHTGPMIWRDKSANTWNFVLVVDNIPLLIRSYIFIKHLIFSVTNNKSYNFLPWFSVRLISGWYTALTTII